MTGETEACKLFVNLPDDYAKDTTKTNPVFYALDGKGTFGPTTFIYNGIRYDAFVPEMIIIGITYDGTNPDYGLLRGKDLTPTTIENNESSGGAPNFLNVLGDEVIPIIDRLY